MAQERCELCKEYGFSCSRANLLERITGRQKIVTMQQTGQKLAHDFPIETCEVVTGEVSAKKYASTLNRYVEARNSGLIR